MATSEARAGCSFLHTTLVLYGVGSLESSTVHKEVRQGIRAVTERAFGGGGGGGEEGEREGERGGAGGGAAAREREGGGEGGSTGSAASAADISSLIGAFAGVQV